MSEMKKNPIDANCAAVDDQPPTPGPGILARRLLIDSVERCHSDRDGDCVHANCPQLRDGEPRKSGRHCPLDTWEDLDE